MIRSLVSILAAIVFAAGLSQIGRPGYSVDEEFTVFAVRGIHAHGVPLLPSGLLYDRGLAYSYVAALTGESLPADRTISLVCASLAVVLAFALVRHLAGESAAVFAALLVTMSVPFWATATSGRFYSPFFLLYLATLLSLQSNLLLIITAAFFCRLTHELAFTLALIPLLCAIADRDRRRSWIVAAAAVIAGLVAAQAAIFALHALQPAAGETMVRRFFLWQVLNLFVRPGDRQFMIPLVVMLIAWVAAPQRSWTISVAALSIASMVLALSLARATNTGPMSVALVQSILVDGSRYPMHMFWSIAKTTPLTLVMAMVFLLLRLGGAGGEWPRAERVLHGLWIGWVLWFGVIDSGITTNYLLLPVSFMLMAIAVDAFAILIRPGVPARRYFNVPQRPAYAGLAAIALIAGVDQWRGKSIDEARPTIQVDAFRDVRDSLQPTDRIACTDELGCLMTVGRIDRWLALDDYVRERFVVRSGNGPVTGVYTGAPAIFRPADLFAPNADGSFPDRVLIVDIFKEYPIGNSRSWLARAIAQDGVRVETLMETSQARVIEIHPPEQAARVIARER